MSDSPTADPSKEFDAIRTIHATLAELAPEARSRVIAYLANVLRIDSGGALRSSTREASTARGGQAHDQPPVRSNAAAASTDFATFADFCNAASPGSGIDRVLVAGYWLQVVGQQDGFSSQDANKELKHLGHQSTNITRDLDHLQAGSPKLVIQVKKSGNTKQARKLYKLTHAGIIKVKEMLGE